MYDIKQAEEALRKKHLDDMHKRLAYYAHCQNVENVEFLGLPYKVIKEQTDLCTKKREVPPNIFYPKNWKTLDDFSEWLKKNHPDIAELRNDNKKWLGYIFDFSKHEGTGAASLEEVKSDKYRAIRKEYEEGQQSFNNYTSEGIQQRKYYMARFLKGYDLNTFSMFDLYGSVNHTQEQAEQFRCELIELQTDFERDPQKYFTREILLPNDKVAEDRPKC